MLKRKWALFAVAVVAVIAVAITAFWFFAIEPSSYVAKVGNTKISKSEYNIYLNLIKYQMSTYYGITDWNSTVGGEKASDYVKKIALEQVVDNKIKQIKAKESNTKLTSADESDIDTQIKAIESQYGGRSAAQKGIKAEMGVSLENYKAFLKNDRIVQNYLAAEKEKAGISEADAKKAYDESPKDYDKVTVRHILFMTVGSDGTTPLADDKIKEAEKKANDTLAKAKSGEDFATLAKQLTEDTSSKEDGGKIEFGAGEMVTEFENWALDAARKPGDLGIVKTKFGYHVMKFESKLDFNALKSTIIGSIFDKQFSDKMEAWKKETQFAVSKNTKAYNSIIVKNNQ